jgi:hypothetical protein
MHSIPVTIEEKKRRTREEVKALRKHVKALKHLGYCTMPMQKELDRLTTWYNHSSGHFFPAIRNDRKPLFGGPNEALAFIMEEAYEKGVNDTLESIKRTMRIKC